LDEREIHPKPDDPKVTRIVRYESGTGEVIEIIEVPDPHKAAEYKVPTNDELRPKPGCRFKEKQRLGRVGGATPLFTGVRGRVFLRSSRQGWHRASVHGIIRTRGSTQAK
jgi:hypothetical protein